MLGSCPLQRPHCPRFGVSLLWGIVAWGCPLGRTQGHTGGHVPCLWGIPYWHGFFLVISVPLGWVPAFWFVSKENQGLLAQCHLALTWVW